MERKRLVNEYEAENEDGRRLSSEFSQVVIPIIEKWVKEGYSTIDIEHLLNAEISIAICTERLQLQHDLVKSKRKNMGR